MSVFCFFSLKISSLARAFALKKKNRTEAGRFWNFTPVQVPAAALPWRMSSLDTMGSRIIPARLPEEEDDDELHCFLKFFFRAKSRLSTVSFFFSDTLPPSLPPSRALLSPSLSISLAPKKATNQIKNSPQRPAGDRRPSKAASACASQAAFPLASPCKVRAPSA